MPATTGNGLAMRAGTILEALAPHYTVSVLVIPLYEPVNNAVPPEFARLCQSFAVSPPTPESSRGFRTVADSEPFDVVHVFRMALIRFARPFLSPSSRLHLDLDDIEPLTHRGVAAICL